MQSKRIGFVSTRLAGTDGVSLETRKWAHVLELEGHACFYMAGESDMPAGKSLVVPECHFSHPAIEETYNGCFGHNRRRPAMTRRIEELKHRLKRQLETFVKRFKLDLLISENAVTIPMNLPLGLAITEFTCENDLQVIAHHHDFFWERKRFLHNCCWDYLNMAFPPHVLRMHHAVLNSSQDHQLSMRRGLSAEIIPNVMDFGNPPPEPDGYADDLRETLGMSPDHKLILQPTRIVKRKGIEHAVELVRRLGIPAKLVVTHEPENEGDDGEYATHVREYAELLGVDAVFCSDIVGDERGKLADGRKVYTLADCYEQSDLVTYPSTIEGFGNAFLEALYYRRPMVVNNYSIFNSDIRPKGFWVIEMFDYVSERTLRHAREVLESPDLAKRMADHNYDLARKFFSFEMLRQKLNTLLVDCFGS